jgi:hypothetical protein
MTYAESNALMADAAFIGRVKVACLTYAEYISNEAPDVPAHNARLRWANSCMVNPDFAANQVTPPTVMDPAVQAAGPSITDEALQTAVEGTVNKLI